MKGKDEKETLKYYNQYLTEIQRDISNGTTYSNVLEKYCRKLFKGKFKGVYPSDKVPKLNKLKKYCILNLDKSGLPGSHWIALAYVNDNKYILYDSFGRKYSEIIPHLTKQTKVKIEDTDYDKEQKVKELNCGARCIAFLKVFDEHGYNKAKLI